MKSEILKNVIVRLSEIRPNESPLISCFVDLQSPAHQYLSELEARTKFIAKTLRGTRQDEFLDAFEQIRDYLKNSLRPSSKSLAIYARWGDEPVLVPLQFEVPIDSGLMVDSIPHIYPLIELKDTYHRFVTVVTTETEARILETTVGSVTENILAERPELRSRVGREWTREHYHNHKREREQQFIKEKIRILDELMSRRGHNHIIIAGSPKMASRLMNALPERLRCKVIDTFSANPNAGIDPILIESVRLFAEAEDSESHSRVIELKSAVLTGGLGVIGYEASVEALENGYADMLVIDQEFETVEERETLVRLATLSGAMIETVKDSETMEQLGGVGCLLRYQPHAMAIEPIVFAA